MALSLFNDPMLSDMERNMDRMFDRAFGRWALAPPQHPAGHTTDLFRTLGSNSHAFDVIEKKDSFELIADAPGFDVADISVELHDKVLTITGKHKEEAEEKGADGEVWRSERRMQHFRRSFALPDNTDPDAIAASLDKGVLTVRVPKVEEAPKPEPKRIHVRTA